MVEESTLLGCREVTMSRSPANDGADGSHKEAVCMTSDVVVDSLDHGTASRNTDHIIAGPPMPPSRISSDRRKLGFDLATNRDPGKRLYISISCLTVSFVLLGRARNSQV
jgi:hypothetical protein